MERENGWSPGSISAEKERGKEWETATGIICLNKMKYYFLFCWMYSFIIQMELSFDLNLSTWRADSSEAAICCVVLTSYTPIQSFMFIGRVLRLMLLLLIYISGTQFGFVHSGRWFPCHVQLFVIAQQCVTHFQESVYIAMFVNGGQMALTYHTSFE